MARGISPILRNKLEALDVNRKHDKIYEHLTRHANDVKPNEPKAKLIRENVLQSAVSGVQDVFDDGRNFVKASKTGVLNDNKLGRINDLGMKAGALLIATYLASHAKTKTDAIMQFIGGTTFFASMALWPKLFINLPARIVHGFKIDHKYMSAQGDKKDLGLDNQFQPMDIFSDKELLDMAAKSGIDPTDIHAKEKMQRKLQKTMLQNRTLWMATAGFATPLMTSVVGNALEPKVRDAVINYGIKKAGNALDNQENLNVYLLKTAQKGKKSQELGRIIKNYSNTPIDEEFYKQIANALDLSEILKNFKDFDDITPVKNLKSADLIEAIKELREQTATVDKEELTKNLSQIQILNKNGLLVGAKTEDLAVLGSERAKELIESIEGNLTISKIREVLRQQSGIGENQIEELLKSLKTNDTEFLKQLSDYNETVLPVLKGRLKGYIDLINPLVGSKTESAQTREFNNSMKKMLEILNISDKECRALAKGTIQDQQEFLSKKMSDFVRKNPANYLEILTGKTAQEILEGNVAQDVTSAFSDIVKQFCESKELNKNEVLKEALTKLFGEKFYLVENEEEFKNFAQYITIDNEIWKNEIVEKYLKLIQKTQSFPEIISGNAGSAAEAVMKRENIEQIGNTGKGFNGITKALLGIKEDKADLYDTLENFIKNKRTDLLATKYKPIICANFEARLANKEFQNLTEQEIKAIRNILYDGTISMRFNNAEIKNPNLYNALIKQIFNPAAFNREEAAIPGIKQAVKDLAAAASSNTKDTNTVQYLKTGSFSELVKGYATRIFENKAWKKIFFPMAIALVGITLVVQPLFGKIDKEFPEKKVKKGGAE